MELTVMSKARFDGLLEKLNQLETQTAFVQSQLTAMHESNSHLAEIAFDEGKFTNLLMDKVEQTAIEAARSHIDTEDIAREASEFIDVTGDVERHMERMDVVTKDDVNDLIQDFINNESIPTMGEVEQTFEDYIASNCDFVEKDVTDQLHDDIKELREEMQEMKQEIIKAVLQLIANKLTGKESHHADNNHEGTNGVHISGTAGHSQEQGNGTLMSS